MSLHRTLTAREKVILIVTAVLALYAIVHYGFLGSFIDEYGATRRAIDNANKDLGYFLEMVKDLSTESQIAEGTSANLQAAVDAGMGDGNVPEILDYFLKL